MESSPLKLIDGTAALSVAEQVEEEFAKDRWDAHNIPGLRYAPHRTDYHIDFQLIPGVFRPVVKEFMKFKIATGVATSTLIRGTYCLRNFLTFFSIQYPHVSTLQRLSKQDMDTFILELKSQASMRGLRDITQHIAHHVSMSKISSTILNALRARSNPLSQPPVSSGRIITPRETNLDQGASNTYRRRYLTNWMRTYKIYPQP